MHIISEKALPSVTVSQPNCNIVLLPLFPHVRNGNVIEEQETAAITVAFQRNRCFIVTLNISPEHEGKLAELHAKKSTNLCRV